MRERVKLVLLIAACLLTAPSARAQVGHMPANSPYLDLEYNQELTLFGGWVHTREDAARVTPKDFATLGLGYEITLAGPFAMSANFYGGSTKRDVVDPVLPALTRRIGQQTTTQIGGDLAAAMNLTGKRSWHNLVPQVRLGLGFLHNSAADDSSGFSMGTRFAFSWGGGVKYVRPGSRLQVRADITDRMFKIEYPDSYYRLASDNSAVIGGTTPRSFYTHHTFFTVGLSYLFAR